MAKTELPLDQIIQGDCVDVLNRFQKNLLI